MVESGLIVYKCVVCGKAFTKVQSLRAHLKVHKGEVEWENFTVRIPRSLASRFKGVCRKHNTTTCHLIAALMEATLKGEELGVINIGSPNPVVIHVSHTFLGEPRSAWKVPVSPSRLLWPPNCEGADQFLRGAKEVGCLKVRDWVRLEECWGCFQRGGKQP